MATQKEEIEKLVELMKKWQKLEDAAVQNTTEIIKNTDNPLIQIVMEIIRQDSVMHRRVQQMVIDNFEKAAFSMNVEELITMWDKVEAHDELELKVIAFAEEAKANTKNGFVQYLLDYLLTDEKKHHALLEEMSKIKNKMYPYG